MGRFHVGPVLTVGCVFTRTLRLSAAC
jgi:hypothetical protein